MIRKAAKGSLIVKKELETQKLIRIRLKEGKENLELASNEKTALKALLVVLLRDKEEKVLRTFLGSKTWKKKLSQLNQKPHPRERQEGRRKDVS